MDLVKIAQEFGAYAAVAVFYGWWLKTSLSDRIKALETSNSDSKREVSDLNKYIREEQSKLIAEGHIREREFVMIIRELRQARGEPIEPLPDSPPRTNRGEEDTQRIMAAVEAKHGKTPRDGSRVLRGISGLP